MSEEENIENVEPEVAENPAAEAPAESVDSTDAAAPEAAAEVEADEKPKPARKPRAAKPKAEAAEAEADEAVAEEPKAETEAVADAAADAPEAEAKPKRTRAAAKPKAEDKPKAEKTEDKKPAAPAPSRRRGAREPGAPVPVVRAQAKYVRSSARKARLVCDNIRGKSVVDARAILAHTPRAVARDWSKLLESAIANAEHNHELDGEDLVIKAVTADEGPTIKRFRPRAQGRATQIRKRTSHLTILLTPKN